jgi:hypothetical protein
MTWANVSSVNVPVRQTVLSGDATSGVASFLTTGSGLTPAFTATAPLVMTFAGGFGANGAVDLVTSLSSGSATAACPASNTDYVYATYASATSVTWGCTSQQPAYQTTAPSSPATGQYWLNTASYVMQSWSGATWVASNTVFVGEAVAGSSTISSVVSYAFQGQYAAPWTNTLPSAAALTTFADNLGTQLKDVKFEAMDLTAELGASVGDIVELYSADSIVAFPVAPNKRRNATLIQAGASGWYITNASGTHSVMTAANWAYRIRAKRSF